MNGIFNLEGKKIGQYEGEIDTTSDNRSYLLCPPYTVHLVIPEDLDPDTVKAVLIDAVEVPEEIIEPAIEVPAVPAIPAVPGTDPVPAVGEPGDEDYQPEIPGTPGTPEVPEVPAYTIPAVVKPAYTIEAHYEVQIDSALVAAKAAAGKAAQVQALYDEMVTDVYDKMEILFGTRNDVSAAATASTWEAMEKRPANYVGLNPQLNSVEAVSAYATAQLNAADNYAKWRLVRLAQFNAAKAAVLA